MAASATLSYLNRRFVKTKNAALIPMMMTMASCVVARPEQKISAEDLDTLCLSAIARFNRPRDYVFLEALPKNNYGKVLKTELRKLHGQTENKTNT